MRKESVLEKTFKGYMSARQKISLFSEESALQPSTTIHNRGGQETEQGIIQENIAPKDTAPVMDSH